MYNLRSLEWWYQSGEQAGAMKESGYMNRVASICNRALAPLSYTR